AVLGEGLRDESVVAGVDAGRVQVPVHLDEAGLLVDFELGPAALGYLDDDVGDARLAGAGRDHHVIAGVVAAGEHAAAVTGKPGGRGFRGMRRGFRKGATVRLLPVRLGDREEAPGPAADALGVFLGLLRNHRRYRRGRRRRLVPVRLEHRPAAARVRDLLDG